MLGMHENGYILSFDIEIDMITEILQARAAFHFIAFWNRVLSIQRLPGRPVRRA